MIVAASHGRLIPLLMHDCRLLPLKKDVATPSRVIVFSTSRGPRIQLDVELVTIRPLSTGRVVVYNMEYMIVATPYG